MAKKSILILIVLVLAACGSDGPRDTVEDYLSRIEDRDAGGANQLLCQASTAKAMEQTEFEGVRTIDFRNMKYVSVNEESIRVTGTAVMEQADQHVEMKFDTTFKLAAQNDAWCIQEVGSISP